MKRQKGQEERLKYLTDFTELDYQDRCLKFLFHDILEASRTQLVDVKLAAAEDNAGRQGTHIKKPT